MYRNALENMIRDDIKPNNLHDTEYLISYLNNKNNDDPILLTLGETWNRIPSRLVENLNESENYEHGYQISMYGLPSFRRTLKEYIFKTEQINESFNKKLEVAVSWNGTRSSMVDYGRFILEKFDNKGKRPVFISTNPGWDYEGVYIPLGFESEQIPLQEENNFLPTLEEFERIINKVNNSEDKYIAFIVINAQHNPTGNNWSEDLVDGLIKLSAQNKCGLLIDNAYYGVTQRQENKTSTWSLVEKNWDLLSSLNTTDLLFGTRSLGKQFHCNGWGIGGIIATPTTLDEIVNKYRPIHSYNYNAVLQKAMEKWISSPLHISFLDELNSEKKLIDELILNTFIEKLNYPRNAIHIGEYAPYVLLKIPLDYQQKENGLKQYIKDLFFKTGVLVTDCWALPRNNNKYSHLNYIRMYTGVNIDVMKEALDRIVKNDFLYI